LEAERRTLLGGSPEAIAAVTRRKLDLADRIEREHGAGRTPADGAEALAALARYNRENAVICTAMLRELGDALDRLRQHEPHRSYNPDGSETHPPTRHPLGAA
jgi:hypothetical protein